MNDSLLRHSSRPLAAADSADSGTLPALSFRRLALPTLKTKGTA